MDFSRGQIRVASAPVALARLRRWLPGAFLNVLSTLERRGGRAVLVGGAVRDALLNRRPPDWDVATDLPPGVVAALFPKVSRAGEKHGTIMVLTRAGPVEVTTFRGEGAYMDGRRPSNVVFHGDLERDLSRRDFTINAVAADLAAGELVDPFDGIADLRRRRVRAVGVARERFAEDGLRPLRAVRFAAVLGFALDPETRAALGSGPETFARVAWERKRDELSRLLAGAVRLAPAVRLLEEAGLLEALAPELCGTPLRVLAAIDALERDPWLRFAGWACGRGVASPAAAQVLARWRVARVDQAAVERTVGAFQALGAVPFRGAELRKWLARHGADAGMAAARVAEALEPRRFSGSAAAVRRLLAARPCLSVADLALDGHDLHELGLSGPEVGRTLRTLLDRVLDSPASNTRARLLRLLHTLSTTSRPPF
jgi:tRNA nucleotidyltransferase (CCA-adding enzyme)